MREPIRVLIVDDSALIRQMLTRALSMDPRLEIVGTAKNGAEAIIKASELNPDVITLDIEMPELTGLEALPYLSKRSQARIVMLSSLDDPETTYAALARGAVDFIPKPAAGMATSITELTETLLKTIKMAYRVPPEKAAAVVSDMQLPFPIRASRSRRVPVPVAHPGNLPAGVCIASSTGGPPALERVFAGLSATMDATYVVVQHLPDGFAESLARRLNAITEVTVGLAKRGDVLKPGHAYVAPYGSHIVLERQRDEVFIRFDDAPPLHGIRPAADPLFRSAADVFGERAVGVVLTGMGSDGGDGALAIRRAGGEVVVQDEKSSIVWGMPAAALGRGAATRSVAIGLVAAEIRRAVRSRVPGGVVDG